MLDIIENRFSVQHILTQAHVYAWQPEILFRKRHYFYGVRPFLLAGCPCIIFLVFHLGVEIEIDC